MATFFLSLCIPRTRPRLHGNRDTLRAPFHASASWPHRLDALASCTGKPSCGPGLYFAMPRASHREVEIKLPVPDIQARSPRAARPQGAQPGPGPRAKHPLRHSRSRLALRRHPVAPSPRDAGSRRLVTTRMRKCLITSKIPPGTVRPHSKYKERLEREALVRARSLAPLPFESWDLPQSSATKNSGRHFASRAFIWTWTKHRRHLPGTRR